MVEEDNFSCRLLHHGAAASSSSKILQLIPRLSSSTSPESGECEIVYSSDAILNIAQQTSIELGEKENGEIIWSVQQTLRTKTKASITNSNTVSTVTAKREITCVSLAHTAESGVTAATVLLCGFSDGTLTSWTRSANIGTWNEKVLVNDCDKEYGRSITDIGGMLLEDGESIIAVSCSSGGVDYHESLCNSPLSTISLIQTPANVVRFETLQSGATLVLVGTASPRNNKIHIYIYTGQQLPVYSGFLSGHEDWISCFDWCHTSALDFLASGSQDARIRLWKFESDLSESMTPELKQPSLDQVLSDEECVEDGDDIEQGESRLEIFHDKGVTSVFLEALLIGHEESVTAVTWHPCPQSIYGQDMILISSSMDRTILIWGEHETGIWTPISRVGSAGGILGGSVGSSLLGFLNVKIEPEKGDWLLGHGYGGALHIFSPDVSNSTSVQEVLLSVEERASMIPWKAMSCVTGHFDAISDMCWEAEKGLYLVTASNDQTCRVWAPVKTDSGEAWMEIARPQVHGYGINAITSLSTSDHRHMILSASDEKEIRAFDATSGFLRCLRMLSVGEFCDEDLIERVERAFIPSLGLSNKATAADGAEEDTSEVFSKSGSKLPLERDLGSMSLWPEVRKLYGHTSEVACLASTLEAQSSKVNSDLLHSDVLVASSSKARDIETASIRIWDVMENRCLQVLTGGHKSTVVALCFSPNGKYLVSSGKDRRLCLWARGQRKEPQGSGSQDLFHLCAAVDSSHKRIVWGAHFCPLNSSLFASCSRDGSIKIWNILASDGSSTELKDSFQFNPITQSQNNKPESVTAVAFAPFKMKETALLALGLENGFIELWTVPLFPENGRIPKLVEAINPQQCHASAVKKIAWRPIGKNLSEASLVFATCSSDNGCRIFKVSWSSSCP